jgi:hypothetical protein
MRIFFLKTVAGDVDVGQEQTKVAGFFVSFERNCFLHFETPGLLAIGIGSKVIAHKEPA